MIMLGDEVGLMTGATVRADPEWLRAAASGLGPEGALLAGLKSLLEVRSSPEWDPDALPEPIDLSDHGAIGFRRGSILVVVNMTNRLMVVSTTGPTKRELASDDLTSGDLASGELVDLITHDVWDGHLLGPYEYRYVSE